MARNDTLRKPRRAIFSSGPQADVHMQAVLTLQGGGYLLAPRTIQARLLNAAEYTSESRSHLSKENLGDRLRKIPPCREP